jgi:Ca-activated chloride channel family protein
VINLAGLGFASPWWLLAALAGPFVIALAILRERRGQAAIVFPGLSRLGLAVPGLRRQLRHLPVVLAGAGLALAAVALARPQRGPDHHSVTTRGVDLVITLDVSGSMAAEDFQPRNRLAVAKDVVASFIRRRTTDRVGLVAFASQALTKSPATTDTAVLLRQLDDVHLDMLPDGTAIGSGIATALQRLRRSVAKSKVIVLVTDGGNNAGEIDPATAADIARAMGVRIYTVGVGKGGVVPMPVTMRDPLTGATTKRTMPMQVDIDEKLLVAIAARTGGEFFRATDSASMRLIFDRIDALEKSEIKLAAYRQYRELYRPFLVAAAALLAAAAAAWVSGLRVVPA